MSVQDEMRATMLSFGKSPEEADQFVAEQMADAAKIRRGIEARALRRAAARLVTYCPDHGDRDTAFITCQCIAAEELLRIAGELDEGEE